MVYARFSSLLIHQISITTLFFDLSIKQQNLFVYLDVHFEFFLLYFSQASCQGYPNNKISLYLHEWDVDECVCVLAYEHVCVCILSTVVFVLGNSERYERRELSEQQLTIQISYM